MTDHRRIGSTDSTCELSFSHVFLMNYLVTYNIGEIIFMSNFLAVKLHIIHNSNTIRLMMCHERQNYDNLLNVHSRSLNNWQNYDNPPSGPKD